MAAVEVTISGVLYDKTARTTQPVVLIGEASLTGLGVGGGPIIPPGQPPSGGGGPPGIWGPTDPRPTPPIANVPGLPPTTDPPPIDPNTPPVQWKTLWTPTEGWVVVGIVNPQGPHPAPGTAPA